MSVIDTIISSLESEPSRWRWSYRFLKRDDGLSMRPESLICYVTLPDGTQYDPGFFEKRRLLKAVRRFKEASFAAFGVDLGKGDKLP